MVLEKLVNRLFAAFAGSKSSNEGK